MWVFGLVLVLLAAGAAASMLLASRQRARRTTVPTRPRPDGSHAGRWEDRAEELRATKPSQAQATESPAQQQAPRASDS